MSKKYDLSDVHVFDSNSESRNGLTKALEAEGLKTSSSESLLELDLSLRFSRVRAETYIINNHGKLISSHADCQEVGSQVLSSIRESDKGAKVIIYSSDKHCCRKKAKKLDADFISMESDTNYSSIINFITTK